MSASDLRRTFPEVWAVARREDTGSRPTLEAREPRGVDPVLLGVVLALVGFGVVMVYSASAVYAAKKFGAADYFLRRDLLWAGFGLVAFAVATRIDYSLYRRYVYPLLIASLLLLVAVLVVGVRINGARRWFHLGPISFQPGELAKVAVMIYLAHSLTKKAEKVKSFTYGFLPHIGVAGLVMLLLLAQPDLGTGVVLGMATMLLLFVAGTRVRDILMTILAALPVLYALLSTGFRLKRMLAFLNPWAYRYDVGYQVTQSLIAIGSGGLFGLGLGDSRQKLLFLPEAHTDYIGAIIGEELGFVGLVGVTLAFTVFVWRGVRASLRARDAFGTYLAFGITALIGFQALVNLAVVLGSLPSKGLPLPFISFGGSALVVELFGLGILLNISRAAPAAGTPTLMPTMWSTAIDWVFSHGNRRRGRRVVIETGAEGVPVRRDGGTSTSTSSARSQPSQPSPSEEAARPDPVVAAAPSPSSAAAVPEAVPHALTAEATIRDLPRDELDLLRGEAAEPGEEDR